MMYPEPLLVFRKDRKNVMTEEEKQGMFMVVTTEANIVGEYIQGKKCTKYAASQLKRCIHIGNVVHIYGQYGSA